MNTIEPRIIRLIQDKDIFVLRERATDRALNVSYSPAGLTWTTNATGRLIFYENAKLQRFIVEEKKIVAIVSSNGEPLKIDTKYYVEKFVPSDKYHAYKKDLDGKPMIDRKNQVAEYTWTDKAYRLITNSAMSPDAYTFTR